VDRTRVRTLIWIGVVLLLAFVALQFIRPKIGNPAITADLQAPSNVKEILRISCYNCHSNETKLAWFDEVVPAYWLVARDVKEARKHVNFSEIGAQPAAAQKATLYEAVNQIQFGAMPLPSYRRVHPGAAVTADQLAVLRAYLNPPIPIAAASFADVRAADQQFAVWMAATADNQLAQVSLAPNGIAFPSGYKNWKAVSTTDRFDNQTMRAVLGNDVAIKAIAERHTNPWPDGVTFAKVAWKQQPEETGLVRTGAFVQVEFMIKDAKKYAATLGWGFARWRGSDLQPYGKDAAFTAECVGCHTPLRPTDYVFTTPVKQDAAALNGDLPSDPLQWKVIATALNHRDSTMSTLFGNDIAVNYVRTYVQQKYPAGSVLALVTWTGQEDPHWFGARIPAAPKSVEFLSISAAGDQRLSFAYQKFAGAPLTKVSSQETPTPNEPSAFILTMRAAVMP
jgi:mono/diheme cytochrome c family protein